MNSRRPPVATAAIALTISLHLAGSGPVAPAALAQAPAPAARLADVDVNRSIQAAVEWLRATRNEDGNWERFKAPEDVHWAGDTALVCLALLYADVDPRKAEWLSESLDWLIRQKVNGTYAVGTRAHALAIVPGFKYRAELRRDLQWLLDAAYSPASPTPGAYNYTPPAGKQAGGRWDNSCTQFGVLGVWMAAEAGLDVPRWYWDAVGGHWMRTQNTDGGWEYTQAERGAKPQSTGSMTAAGVASLFVVLDQQSAASGEPAPTQGPLLRAIENGMEWLARNYGQDNPGGAFAWKYYYLYGVERVGRASGHKYFGRHDWFREGAAALIELQRADGSWPASAGPMDAQRNTALALMYLCHGRAPLLFNKLQRPGQELGPLRDVAGLTRFASATLERLLNWQLVPLDGPVEDLFDAPVLYLYGRERADFTDVEVDRLREYALRGGLFVTVVGRGGDAFLSSVEELARRAFPEYPLEVLPDDHPLLSGAAAFRLAAPPRLLGVSNGHRLLMLVCTRDVATSWARYSSSGRAEADLQLGVNIYALATDKTTPRTRLETPILPLKDRQPSRTIELVRLRHDGDWDIEPLGWTRLARYLANEANTRLLVTSGVRLDDEALSNYRVAHLTGTRAFTLSPAEQAGLRRFLASGGTLLADAATGSSAFIEAFETQLRAALDESPTALSPDSFLVTGAGLENGVDASKVGHRRAAMLAAGGRSGPVLRAFGSRRRHTVIYTPLDLSVGLLGTNVFNLKGYEPEGVLKVMRNLVLYAALPATEKAALHRGGP